MRDHDAMRRRVFYQCWTEYLTGAVWIGIAVAVGSVTEFGAKNLIMLAFLVAVVVVLVRPRVVASPSGLAVTHVVGRRKKYRWDEIDSVAIRPESELGETSDYACVLITLRGRTGLDAVEDLPFLPAGDEPPRWRLFARARLRHSLAVCSELQAELGRWRESQQAAV